MTVVNKKPKILDKQLAKLPKKVIFCKRCVVSNQRPRITFDKAGICSACRYHEEKHYQIDWRQREHELVKLLDKHRSKDGRWDVVVPVSGGKDSAYVSHQLKSRYGMHPLTVTWTPFIYTDIGWKNYNNFVAAGFDNLFFNPDGHLHRKLSRVAFELKGDAWEPFTFGQKAYAFHVALKFGIPLIVYGENGEVEYGGSVKNKNVPFESVKDWEELYFKGVGVDALIKAGLQTGIFRKSEIEPETFALYRPPSLAKINQLGIQMHWFSYYHKWIPQENFYYATKYTNFEANPDGRSEGTYTKYSSLDDKTDGFHFYLSYIKFGLGRASRDAQMEIRSRHITREEGVALVRRYDGEFPKKYFKEFLEYLDITEPHFWKIIDRYRLPHLWEKIKGKWHLKHVVS